MSSNTEYPEIQLISPEEYAPIKSDAIKKLAGHPGMTEEMFKTIANVLGLDEDLKWKTSLKLVI